MSYCTRCYKFIFSHQAKLCLQPSCPKKEDNNTPNYSSGFDYHTPSPSPSYDPPSSTDSFSGGGGDFGGGGASGDW